MDLGYLGCFHVAKRRQKRRDGFCEARLAGAGRADHQEMVTPCYRDLERPLGRLLSADC
jgi:hypothetical protein